MSTSYATLSRAGGAALAALVALVGLVFLAPSAHALGTLDQNQPANNVCDPLDTTHSTAQTFTAGLTGELDQINIGLTKTGDPVGVVTLQLREVVGGVPSDVVLATATVTAASLIAGPQEVAFAFAAPADVVAGTQYAFTVSYPQAADVANSLCQLRQNTDVYAGGQAFSSPTSPPSTFAPVVGDYGFRTYVTAAPIFSVSPGTKAFGTQTVGSATTAQTFTVTNNGTAVLNITAVALTGANPTQFTLSNDTCTGGNLAPGATCSVQVAFAPTSLGAKTANLTFTDNANGSPHSVALTGTGTPVVGPDPDPDPDPNRGVCLGEAATIVGTQGNDVLRGTPGRDVIRGRGGDDVIAGLGGNDVLCGGGGNDVVRGGPGADRINGGSGHDRLFGGSGDDRLLGGLGDDRMFGRAGNDRLLGSFGDDYLVGGRGFDRLFGGPGNDTRIQ